MEELTYKGVSINATVSFTVAQAVQAAEAVERGLKRREVIFLLILGTVHMIFNIEFIELILFVLIYHRTPCYYSESNPSDHGCFDYYHVLIQAEDLPVDSMGPVITVMVGRVDDALRILSIIMCPTKFKPQ